MITQEQLKKCVNYDPETGIFTWVNSGRKNKKGMPAGLENIQGYIYFRIGNYKSTAHRFAWLYMIGSFPEYNIDHINGVKNDNKFSNLRVATKQENGLNRSKQVNNKSGFKGVSWSKFAKKWHARGVAYGKNQHLGYFENIELAAMAYEAFAKNNHGKFYKGENPCH